MKLIMCILVLMSITGCTTTNRFVADAMKLPGKVPNNESRKLFLKYSFLKPRRIQAPVRYNE